MTIPMLDLTAGVGRGSKAGMDTTWRRFMGIPEEGTAAPRTLREFGRQPADEAWVYACMSVRAAAAASVPLRVQVKGEAGWADIAGVRDGAGEDLQFLLDDVNPAWEGAQLQLFTEAGAAIHGGSYWRKVRGRLGGPPQELHWLSGADVEPVMGRSLPERYKYQPDRIGDRVPEAELIETRDVIAHRDTANLQDPYRLLSPLSAVRYEIATSKSAAEWNAALLANYGVPLGAWVGNERTELGPQEQGFIKRTLRAIRGPRGTGKVPILPGPLTWVPLSMNQKDADWIGSRKASRLTVCAAMGVPLVLAGDDEKSGVYAAARDAERIFWRVQMIPGLDRRASRLDSWLVPEFDRTRRRLRLRYDYSGIEALRAAPAEDMAQWREFVKVGLPLNRAIRRFGMGADVDGGDEPRVMLQSGPISYPEEGEEPVTSSGGLQPSLSTPRPERYRVEATRAADVVRRLGKGLYRDEAVRAFAAKDDVGWLAQLGVAADELDQLATGLRRRYSADQLLAGVPDEGYPALPAAAKAPALRVEWDPPAQPTPVVNIAPAEVTVAAPVVTIDDAKTAEALSAVGERLGAFGSEIAALRTTLEAPRTVTKTIVRDEHGRPSGLVETTT